MNSLQNHHFHFIAIGGVGMSGLAKYLLKKGCIVTGSDVQENKYTRALKELGATVYKGHNENNISGTPMVVASTAIQDDNVEIVKAKKMNLKILHRSDLLQMMAKEFSDADDSVFFGYSGTHGKTTTSGLAAFLLAKSGLNPSYVVGGIVPELNTNAECGSEKFFTAELDESDGTILKYQPDITVINNLEVDHIDFYKNGFEDLIETFSTFISNLKPDAKLIINTDCEGNKKLINANSERKFITYGLNNAQYTAKNIVFNKFASKFSVFHNETKLADISLSVPGTHNIYNALSVFVSLFEAGINPDLFVKYFPEFTGMGRRFQLMAKFDNITVIDDYAHHPSEIKATLDSAKAADSTSRLVAVFQPHRYSRFAGLRNEFMKCFDDADKLIVLDVYAASEQPLTEADPSKFAQTIHHPDAVYIGGSMQTAGEKIFPLLKKGDVVITLGAGDVTKIGSVLLNEYNKISTNTK